MPTDLTRWSTLQVSDAPPSWNGRNTTLAKYIPANSTILDIGAGNQALKRLIPESCSYQAVDCVDNGEDVFVIDFNTVDTSTVSLRASYDIAVCSGIMEYIHDADNFFRFVVNHANNVIFTYVPNEVRLDKDNGNNGWVPGLTTDELLALFDRVGLEIVYRDKFRRHLIFMLAPKGHVSHPFIK